MFSKNIWRHLGEEFTNDIPRLTAIIVKESEGTNSFAYPTGGSSTGYNFDFSIKTGYDQAPKFTFEFACFENPNIARVLGPNRIIYKKRTFYPSLIKTDFRYMNIAFAGTERFGSIYENSLSWEFDMHYVTERMNFTKAIYSIISSDELFSAKYGKGSRSAGAPEGRSSLILSFDGLTYHAASNKSFEIGLYPDIYAAKDAMRKNELSVAEKGHILVIKQMFDIRWQGAEKVTFGLSSKSEAMARKATNTEGFEKKVAARWNRWLRTLPVVGRYDGRKFSDDLLKLYYKCWATIKYNYYDHPQWGHSITEALPVYKGIWQWAIPSVEWHSDQNTEYPSLWIKKAMDMMIDSQRSDGYITHAITIDEKVPGSGWGRSNTIQTPHYAWTALRYYHTTLDKASLERWYAPLRKYYDYITLSRDTNLRNIHLWGIFSSYDTGLDTTCAFQKVTYGIDGVKEKYCYPAIFAAERYRYELALAEISDILGLSDGDFFREEAKKTQKAANDILWDAEKKWYGVLHEDGTLDTRVGVDGLFVFVYGLADKRRINSMKPQFERLIGPFGIRTVAEGEEGFCEDVYWRGPCWPKTCSLGMYICSKYYPDLKDKAMTAIVNMVKGYPNVWECYNVRTGEIAHSDHGFYATPNVSSNVGAGDLIGTIYEYMGVPMYDTKPALPLTEISGYHVGGMRVSVTEENGKYAVTAEKAEASSSVVDFIGKDGKRFGVTVEAAKKAVIG